MIDFGAIENEYLMDRNDDDRMRTIKERLGNLKEAEKRIFFLYCDEGSYCGAARILKCSPTTVKKYVDSIRKKLW